MAFYRKYYYGRRWHRRNQLNKWTVEKICRSVIDRRMETKEKTSSIKFQDVSLGSTSANQLTQILHGMQQNEREGDRIRLKQVHIEGWLQVASEATWIRMALVWANYEVAAGGTIPTPQCSWLWDTGLLNNFCWTPRNLDQVTNYCIIWERRFYLKSSNDYMTSVVIFKNLDHIVKYHGGAATAGSRGTMWLICTSDSGTPPHPLFDGVCRIRWKDD